MTKFLTTKAKHWGQAKIEVPPRWEYVPKERSEKLRRPVGWYLYVLTDCGYRWVAYKDLSGAALPEPPPLPEVTPQVVPKLPDLPTQDPVVEEDLDSEPQPKQVDWRDVFLGAITKL